MDLKQMINKNCEFIDEIEKITKSNNNLLDFNVKEQEVFENCSDEELKLTKLEYLKQAHQSIKELNDKNDANVEKFKKLNKLLAKASDKTVEIVNALNDIFKFYKEE